MWVGGGGWGKERQFHGSTPSFPQLSSGTRHNEML